MELTIFEIFKVIFLGIVEGITEWLPISSTGHMLLVDEFLQINASEAFKEMFFVVIQLGAIMAVVLMFWKKMWPFNLKDKSRPFIKRHIFDMWFKVVVACIPGAVVTILFDDYIESHFHTPLVIAATLIIYGILFIVIENNHKGMIPDVKKLSDITYKHALIIGLFQVLSIIPGTSRSGSTIIGALLIGVSRVAAAEFTFFLAIPVMVGASLLQFLKNVSGVLSFTVFEWIYLFAGFAVAFAVSMLCIKWLMSFVRNHDFKPFGWYRIALGALVLATMVIPA